MGLDATEEQEERAVSRERSRSQEKEEMKENGGVESTACTERSIGQLELNEVSSAPIKEFV